MNYYIRTQIINAITFLKLFEQCCKTAAVKDDGRFDLQERDLIGTISSATQDYINVLQSLLKQ